MVSRKGSLTALSLNCRSQEPDNIIIVKDNGLPANLTSKGYFGLAFHCRRHGTCSPCKTSCNAINPNSRIAIGVYYRCQLKVDIPGRGGGRPRLCCYVFWAFGSRRRDDTYRRAFPSRFYGLAHAGTERVVHVKVGAVR
jgi:hypothetical protein